MSDRIQQAGEKTPPRNWVRLWMPTIGVMATLAYASGYDEQGPEVPDIEYIDKVAHFLVYGLLGTLWYRALPRGCQSSLRLFAAFSCTMLYGVVDEWIQASNPVRMADPWDGVADGLGALTALFVYRGWSIYRRLLETPIWDIFRGRIIAEEASPENAES